MGRLFWKIFLGFWVTLVFMGAGVGIAVYIYRANQDSSDVATGRRAEFIVGVVANALQYGGEAGAKSMLQEWPGTRRPMVLVVDSQGRDILGRKVPEAALSHARKALNDMKPSPNLRSVSAPDAKKYILFVPASDAVETTAVRIGIPAYVQIAIALLASLLFSGAFAWYLTKPMRFFRQASYRLADGALDTRITPLLGKRHDEIADLGKDFDYMAERLQTLINAQKQLLHDISHEVRSPLARLRLAIGLFRQQPDKLNLALERIEREAERLDQLLGEMLTLSRLEVGISNDRKEDINLNELLTEIVQDANFEAQTKNCQVKFQADCECVINGHIELLHRAFENIIRNAVKYSKADNTIEVTLRMDGGELALTVCDRGPGVPQAELDAIFLPFYRVHDSQEAHPLGYGLGLAIAQRAIKAHGGTIVATNREGGGLCIETKLPIEERVQ